MAQDRSFAAGTPNGLLHPAKTRYALFCVWRLRCHPRSRIPHCCSDASWRPEQCGQPLATPVGRVRHPCAPASPTVATDSSKRTVERCRAARPHEIGPHLRRRRSSVARASADSVQLVAEWAKQTINKAVSSSRYLRQCLCSLANTPKERTRPRWGEPREAGQEKQFNSESG
jgi:hypothetical protein